MAKILSKSAKLEAFTQASNVIAVPLNWTLGREIRWVPLKLAPPSIFPVTAVAVTVVALLALDVESCAVRVDPLGRCHTPLKLLSHTAVLLDWSVVTDELP